MLDFDEEIQKFSPSKEIDKNEEAVMANANPDISEIIDSLLRERKLNNDK
ncbi:MAG: hypothetical protein II487_03740 [Schwartzia sp.]|nr:hypothetical protein [Schwartzia sp. (in: firmicutes)]